jgi:hypothetical protein
MATRILILVMVVLSLGSLSCGLGEFNDGRCALAIQRSPVRLDGEQVMLTKQQVDCGASSDLWDQPQQFGEDRATAHLSSAGRALKFDDDVSVAEPGQNKPSVQIRGEFPLQVLEIFNTRDEEPGVKLVEVRLGINVPHSCFPQPLLLMGVRKGKFSQDAHPVVRLKQDGTSWSVERLVH